MRQVHLILITGLAFQATGKSTLARNLARRAYPSAPRRIPIT
jgi:hypothetical protein